MTSHTSELEDTPFCYDRSVSAYDSLYASAIENDWFAQGTGIGSSKTIYGTTLRSKYVSLARNNGTTYPYTPQLSCSQPNDNFTVSSSNGNGALTYPVGLITTDEIVMAGGLGWKSNPSYYLNSGVSWWAGSPVRFAGGGAVAWSVVGNGYANDALVNGEVGARVVVSLRLGYTISGGNGTVSNPYTVS